MTAIFNGIGSMSTSLNFHMNRQNLIAANLANVDTPGYVPRELERPTASHPSSIQGQLGIARTDSRHVSANGSSQGEFSVKMEREATPGNDMNYVDIEREMARLSANTIRFEAVAQMLTSRLGMLRYAASDTSR